MTRDMEILDMPERALVPAWEQCVRDALRTKVAVEDEVTKATRAHVSSSLSICLLKSECFPRPSTSNARTIMSRS